MAAPEDLAVVAAMRLAEEPNYAWTTVVSDDARTYAIEGRTERDGLTWQRQPMPESIAKRLGRGADAELEAFFDGPAEYVVRTEQGWKLPDELPRRHRDWTGDEDIIYVPVPVEVNPLRVRDFGAMDPWGTPSIVYVPMEKPEDVRPHSNYQFALSRPHEELAIIVSSHEGLEVDGDTATGRLTDLGARLLLVHDGHEYIRPLAGAGNFKLWLRDRRVIKYALELVGEVIVDKKRMIVRQHNTTVLKDVGTTVLRVPADVRRRLRG